MLLLTDGSSPPAAHFYTGAGEGLSAGRASPREGEGEGISGRKEVLDWTELDVGGWETLGFGPSSLLCHRSNRACRPMEARYGCPAFRYYSRDLSAVIWIVLLRLAGSARMEKFRARAISYGYGPEKVQEIMLHKMYAAHSGNKVPVLRNATPV